MPKKLFQHIASEKELKGLYEKMRLETLNVLGKGNLFTGLNKEWEGLTDGVAELPGEKKEVVTTVMERLNWHRQAVEALTDYELVRDMGNQVAKADVVLDGQTVLKDAPVTWLLAAENRFRAEREILDKIPTLDLSKDWKDTGDGKYKYGPTFVNREEKKTVPVVLHPPTKEHPAIVKEVTEARVIGRFTTTYFSGVIHPAKKAEMLRRIDKVITALKDARLRANELTVQEKEVAGTLFDYILAD